jgi:hypothetical protein
VLPLKFQHFLHWWASPEGLSAAPHN